MLAIATESIVKLVAFITAGAFVTFWMFTPEELIERAIEDAGGGARHRLRAPRSAISSSPRCCRSARS